MFNSEKKVERTKLRPRMTKVYHKKSRNGCQECRARRVKCDENKPTCGHCERRAITCVYPDRSQVQPKRAGGGSRVASKQSMTPPGVLSGIPSFQPLALSRSSDPQANSSPHLSSNSHFPDDIHINIDIHGLNAINGFDGTNDIDVYNHVNGVNVLSGTYSLSSPDNLHGFNGSDGLSGIDCVSKLNYMNNMTESTFHLIESRSRRLLELRLLAFFKDRIANPHPHMIGFESLSSWSSEVPGMALKHDNVQYMMFSLAAGRLHRIEPDNPEYLHAFRVYLTLAVREQKAALENLNVNNCEAVSYTGMMLLIASVATLWRRPLNPYVPPTECLRLGYGVGAVIEAARMLMKDHKDAKIWKFINGPPLLNEEILALDNIVPFQQLLNPSIQPWNPDMHEAYHKAVAYLGYLHTAIQQNDPVSIFGRKLISFSIFVPHEFFGFVEECRPRALVILAHYFGFMVRAKELFWAKEIPEAEIPAIQEIVPPEWQEYLRWPLMMIGQTF